MNAQVTGLRTDSGRIHYHKELIITPLDFGYRPIRGSSGTVPKEFRWAFT
jgi:hypothetical protein